MTGTTDLVFILGASSTGVRHFAAMTAFATQLLSLVTIGTNNTRISIVSYDRTPTTWYSLSAFSRQFDGRSGGNQGGLVQASFNRVLGAIRRSDPGPTSKVHECPFPMRFVSLLLGRPSCPYSMGLSPSGRT